jgi:TonB family protein
MITAALVLAAAVGQAAAPFSDCATAVARGTSPVTVQVCQAEEMLGRAQAVAEDSPEWRRLLQSAADLYKRALALPADEVVKTAVVERLLTLFDAPMLNDPSEMQEAFVQLIALRPTDVDPLLRYARFQEAHGHVEAAEETLLSARRLQPAAVEPIRGLAQFYARRVLAATRTERANDVRDEPPPGSPDKDGVYRVGTGGPAAPRRYGSPSYPPEASASGIQGAVVAEILVNEAGIVSDARVLNSVPVLDEAALRAVREWRYDLTIVDGKPVPIRMTVTVNFTLSR